MYVLLAESADAFLFWTILTTALALSRSAWSILASDSWNWTTKVTMPRDDEPGEHHAQHGGHHPETHRVDLAPQPDGSWVSSAAEAAAGAAWPFPLGCPSKMVNLFPSV